MIDRVVGKIVAAPTPISVRVVISWPGEVVQADRADPIANTAMPASSTRRRPNRSPSRPKVNIRAANASV
jgi:hypothetical protein